MPNDEETKGKVFQILKTAKFKKTDTEKSKLRNNPEVSQTIIGNNNILAGRDVILTEKISKKVVAEIKPGIEHITDKEAATLLDKIKEITKIHNLVKRNQVTPQRYWTSLNRYCGVPRYRLIKTEDFDKALRWCNQQLAILSGTKAAQKKDPVMIRNRQISFIQVNIKKLAIDGNYHNYLKNTFRKISTAELDTIELKKAYNWVATQKKRQD